MTNIGEGVIVMLKHWMRFSDGLTHPTLHAWRLWVLGSTVHLNTTSQRVRLMNRRLTCSVRLMNRRPTCSVSFF